MLQGIKDLLLSLNYQDYNIEILTADAQASYMKGVIVLVTGCLTGKDNVRRKFTETFFLAPQDNGYYVLNDVFRFIEDNNMPVVNSVEEKDLKNIESGAPAMHVEGNWFSPLIFGLILFVLPCGVCFYNGECCFCRDYY